MFGFLFGGGGARDAEPIASDEGGRDTTECACSMQHEIAYLVFYEVQ